MFELFLSFAKIGIMTFGGGIAMLPMMERELVDCKKWISREDLMDYYALGQCTPGAIAVNVATFIGKKEKGVLGGIIATLGVISPSLVISMALAALFSGFSENPIVMHAFAGIRIGVCVVVLNTILKLIKKNIKSIITLTIMITCALLSIIWGTSPVAIAFSVGLIGFIKGKEVD